MSHAIVQRRELLSATLRLGGDPIDLSDYATTGLRVVAVGPSGIGKSNAGFLMAEQLAAQGWVSVLVDPEGEIESIYGQAVEGADDLRQRLVRREQPIVVVAAKDAAEFIPYGLAILEVADKHRKPLFVVMDEGQLFSPPKRRKAAIGEAGDIVNQFSERGRKRALDLFLTAHRYTGSIHRSIFANKNILLIGRQEDAATWSALAPQFRSSKIEFADLAALAPGEFFCLSRRGIEKIRMPMAAALMSVARRAKAVKPLLPATFRQWDRAVREIPTERLQALTDPVVALLGAVAGLSTQQMLSGTRALQDEIAARPS